MFKLINKINQGYTYQDVTDGTHVPISTLWTRYLDFILYCCFIENCNLIILFKKGNFVLLYLEFCFFYEIIK